MGSVHGGASERSPFTSRLPEEVTDMRTDPVVSAPPPRFHALPVSWAGPTSGPDFSQPVELRGPTRQVEVQSQAPPLASVEGSSAIRAPAPSASPHAPSAAAMHMTVRIATI